MLFALWLLAQEAAGAPEQAQPAPGGSPLLTLLPFAAVAVVFYFLMIRPMKRQEQQRQSLLSTLKKNDRVETSGGILGIVSSINEKGDEVTLKVDDNSNLRVRVTKRSIVRILNAEEAKDQKDGGA